MFPEAEKADLPWEELQQQAMKRKQAILAKQTAGNSRASRRSSGRKSTPRSAGRRLHENSPKARTAIFCGGETISTRNRLNG